jgi:hypothetical protein
VRRVVVALAVVLVGCPEEGGMQLTDGMPPPPPDATTEIATIGTSTGTTTGDEVSCDVAMPCPDGTFCVADRDLAQTEPPPPEAFTCRPDCVPTDLVGLWCTSNATCCSAEATCNAETGLCKGPLDGTTTTTATGTSGTDTDSTTAAESSSTSSSSSSGTDSSTGTGTGTAGDTTAAT